MQIQRAAPPSRLPRLHHHLLDRKVVGCTEPNCCIASCQPIQLANHSLDTPVTFGMHACHAGNTLALVWESRELAEIHKQFRKMIARSAGQQAVQLALYATVSGTLRDGSPRLPVTSDTLLLVCGAAGAAVVSPSPSWVQAQEARDICRQCRCAEV